MKPLCLVLLLALSVSSCSRFTKTGRMDRAYYKQIKQVKAEREKHRKNLVKQQRVKVPAPNDPPPLELQTVQSAPSQNQ